MFNFFSFKKVILVVLIVFFLYDTKMGRLRNFRYLFFRTCMMMCDMINSYTHTRYTFNNVNINRLAKSNTHDVIELRARLCVRVYVRSYVHMYWTSWSAVYYDGVNSI